MGVFIKKVRELKFIHIIKSETGMGTVEIVIIIAILVTLALIFRNAILGLLGSLIEKVQLDAKSAAGI